MAVVATVVVVVVTVVTIVIVIIIIVVRSDNSRTSTGVRVFLFIHHHHHQPQSCQIRVLHQMKCRSWRDHLGCAAGSRRRKRGNHFLQRFSSPGGVNGGTA